MLKKKITDYDEENDHPCECEELDGHSFHIKSALVKENEEYARLRCLIYNILECNDFKIINRRRASRNEKKINEYFKIVIEKLKHEEYNICEIFIEFSYYFSENTALVFNLMNCEYQAQLREFLINRYKR